MYRLRVKEILDARKISMGKLSRGADIPMTMVRRLCYDEKYNPSILNLRKVADYLGVSVDDIYVEVPDE